MAKKQTGSSRTAGRKRAGSARGGAKRAAGGRKAAPRKTARKAARKTTARKTTARKTTARKSTAGKRSGTGTRAAATRRAPARARKTTGRGGRATGGQVSSSTTRAKWIESPDERADRPGQTLATRNHDVIRQWAEERGATPATTPGGDTAEPRVLRFNFPGFGGENLQEVDWEDWFRTFDERNLVFLFQEQMKAGNQSNFFQFDNPEREDA